jgi:hypothetical protein
LAYKSSSTFPASLIIFHPTPLTVKTTNKMEPHTLPEATPEMTQQDAHNAISQSKTVAQALDEENESMIRRIHELLDEHESRRHELAEWNLIANVEDDEMARFAVSTTPQKSRLLPTDNAR